jgi:predicted Fe-Mo cluster-binding NifX family protein
LKIAISSTGKDLGSNVDELFGRCPYFIIAETDGKKITKFEAVKNINAEKMGGAGISAAQEVANKGVSVVISGNVGPRASDVLKQFGINVYRGSGKIEEVLKEFNEGKLEKIL